MDKGKREEKLENKTQNSPKKDGMKRSCFSFRNCCLGSIIIFVVIPIILFLIGVYIIKNSEDREQQKLESRNKPESYSLLFSKNLKPDYSFTEDEQNQIETAVFEVMNMSKPAGMEVEEDTDQIFKTMNLENEDKVSAAGDLVAKLKENYPEGYYIIAKSLLLLPPEDKYSFNFWFRGNNSETANTEVHELSHSWASAYFGDYFISGKQYNMLGYSGHLIEDKLIFYRIDNRQMPTGDELLKYISTPTSIDNTYLSENKQILYTTMDEINAYTKSTRVARIYNYYNSEDIDQKSSPQALSRQLYFLALQLQNLKDNYPDIWKLHTENESFAYVMMRLVAIAKNELIVARDEGLDFDKGDESFAGTVNNNLDLFEQYQPIFNEIYTISGIKDYQGKNLNEYELNDLEVMVEWIK